MLGLKRGAVALCPHEKAWETEAQATMAAPNSRAGCSGDGSCWQHRHSHDTGKADH